MNIRTVIQVMPLMALLVSQPISAEIYKWVDENGEVHYSQQKPDSQQGVRMNIVPQPMISGSDGTGNDSGAGAMGLAQQCIGNEDIEQGGTIYCCTASCVNQRRAKNLPFTCATQKCYEALLDSDAERRKAKEAQDMLDKQKAENARMHAEAVRSNERAKQADRQQQMDRQEAIGRRNQQRREQEIQRQLAR